MEGRKNTWQRDYFLWISSLEYTYHPSVRIMLDKFASVCRVSISTYMLLCGGEL